MANSVKIMIADSHVMSRAGLYQLLAREPMFEIVGEASNRIELVQKLKFIRPDVIVLDYCQPDYFEASVMQDIASLTPSAKILVITSDHRKERIYQVLENGVCAFLTKQCGQGEIIDAIKAASRGEKFYCHKILDLIIERSFPGKSEDCTATSLTPREKEILTLVAKGKIAKEIADELNISPHTIYTHRKNIMKKLQFTSPTEMIVYALEHGLVDLR